MTKQTGLINKARRRQRMHELCVWLKDKDQSQTALAKDLGVSQSLLSDHMSAKPDASTPDDENKILFVNYLRYKAPKGKQCDRWDLAEFTRYLDSDMHPEVFTASIRNKPIHSRMSASEIYKSLSKLELIQLIELYVAEERNQLVAA